MDRAKEISERRSDGILQTKRRQLHWDPSKRFRILCLDGGGIKGLFTTAFLAGIEKRFLGGNPIGSYFDYIAGTSTGGIIALGLSSGLSASAIHDLYVDHGKIIFPKARPFGVFRNAYSSDPLRSLSEQAFGERTLGEASTRLSIPSCEAKYGDINVFKTPHHPDYKMDWKVRLKDIALATSAAPTFLPIHPIGNHEFVDGGIWANNPSMVAIVDVLACFDISRDNIDVLSIGTGNVQPKLRPRDRLLGGILTWLSGGFLIQNFSYYSAANALGQSYLLIGKNRYHRIDPPPELASIGLGDYAKAKQLLEPAGYTAAETFPDDIAALFLASPAASPEFFYGPRAAV